MILPETTDTQQFSRCGKRTDKGDDTLVTQD